MHHRRNRSRLNHREQPHHGRNVHARKHQATTPPQPSRAKPRHGLTVQTIVCSLDFLWRVVVLSTNDRATAPHRAKLERPPHGSRILDDESTPTPCPESSRAKPNGIHAKARARPRTVQSSCTARGPGSIEGTAKQNPRNESTAPQCSCPETSGDHAAATIESKATPRAHRANYCLLIGFSLAGGGSIDKR